MTRKMLIKLISDLLVDKFDGVELRAIRMLLRQGTLANIFEDAINKAIETKEAEKFQQENIK